jgi:BON domain-containing protein
MCSISMRNSFTEIGLKWTLAFSSENSDRCSLLIAAPVTIRTGSDDDLPVRATDRKTHTVDAGHPEIKNDRIGTMQKRGAVEIKGTVASAAEKNKAGEIVRGTQGVKDMANGLEVRPDEYADRKQPSVPNR